MNSSISIVYGTALMQERLRNAEARRRRADVPRIPRAR